MIALITATALGLLIEGGPARQADFQLVPQASFNPGGATGEPSPNAPIPLNDAATAPAPDDGATPLRPWRRRRPRPSAQIARGFGHDVPLSFAMRQIVPDGVRVAYGPDVDQDAIVDWVGGRPWDSVVRSTVSPLGLHAVIRGQVVSLTH